MKISPHSSVTAVRAAASVFHGAKPRRAPAAVDLTAKLPRDFCATGHRLKLEFGDDGEAVAQWTFEAMPGGTKVTWEFGGEAQGLLGGFTAAMIESVVVPQFELGLQSLKALAESAAPTEG